MCLCGNVRGNVCDNVGDIVCDSLSLQADQTPEIVEQKTELTVGLSQFVQWDDIASDNEPEAVQSLEAPINLSATSSGGFTAYIFSFSPFKKICGFCWQHCYSFTLLIFRVISATPD